MMPKHSVKLPYSIKLTIANPSFLPCILVEGEGSFLLNIYKDGDLIARAVGENTVFCIGLK
jgi:hypothetical protein